MRILQTCVAAIFAVTAVIFGYYFITEQQKDTTVPVITIDEDVIDVSLNADNAELLRGITAYDEKDGDITDKLIVESISRFTEPGVAVVSYAVCDNDSHVASASRTIRYIGYESPKFTLNDSLVFSLSERVQILDRLGAADVLDGDISSKVIITATDYTDNQTGIFQISAKAVNSRGDTITLSLPVYIEDMSESAPLIQLENHMLYLNVGDSYDPAENLVYAITADGVMITEQVLIESNLDTAKPGVYQIHYYAADANERRGHEILTILVEG